MYGSLIRQEADHGIEACSLKYLYIRNAGA